MRFLQTEWHRHERDRNSWEIEKQEMKGRIASLEGAARRADATQKALKKYVAILENKVKDQAARLRGADAPAGEVGQKPSEAQDRAARLQEKLRGTCLRCNTVAGFFLTCPAPADGPRAPTDEDVDRTSDDEGQRAEFKAFLDQCQAEFTYLMVTPANPPPPRESPPLPLSDELRGAEYLSVDQQLERYLPARSGQNQARELASRPAPAPSDLHAPAAQHAPPAGHGYGNPSPRSAAAARGGDPAAAFGSAEWPPGGPTAEDEAGDGGRAGFGQPEGDVADRGGATEADGWDFNDGGFPDPRGGGGTPASARPDTDVFPAADPPRSPGRGSRGRKGSMSRRRSAEHEPSAAAAAQHAAAAAGGFKLRFGLRGHLDTVRSVIFSGGGSPGEPEICTAGDDGLIKRFHLPRAGHAGGGGVASDLDVQADFTHRGHHGAVLCLASWPPSPGFPAGGRAQGDGWIFSGGQDASVRVWERGRVDPKATLDGHTDAVWALCVLPATLGAVFGQNNPYGAADRILVASGSADGTVRVWAVSAPPRTTSPQPAGAAGSRRGGGGAGGRVRNNSVSSGSGFPSGPQPTVAGSSPFHRTLVHTISRANSAASPTCITAAGGSGETFVVGYSDAAVIVYDTRSGEEVGPMASLETYDGTPETSVNAVVATTTGLERPQPGDDDAGAGPTGGGRGTAGSGVEGVVISGHEDRYIRLFDANSGKSPSPPPPGAALTSVQDSAPTACWRTRRPSRACRSAPGGGSWSAPATTRRCASGASRSGPARKRSRPTGSCAARASAPSSGAGTGGGSSAAAATGSSRFSRGRGAGALSVPRRRARSRSTSLAGRRHRGWR